MPTVNITKGFVDSLGHHANRVLYYDSKLTGFGLRVSGSSRVFFAESRVNHQTRRVSLGKYPIITVHQAREMAQKALSEMRQGIDPNAEKKQALIAATTLQQAFSEFMAVRQLKPKTGYVYERVVETSFPDWLPLPWVNITGEMCLNRHQQLGQDRGVSSANLAFRILRAVIAFSMGRYRDVNDKPLIPENPVDRLTQLHTWFHLDKRTGYIKPHELPKWFTAVLSLKNPTHSDYLQFLLLTGLRKDEAATLTWSEIDFTDKSFTVRDTKNHTPLSLPLSDYLLDLLKRRQQSASCKWVFPNELGTKYLTDVKAPVGRVAKTSGIPFMLHDLRRTFVTIAESLDIPHYALSALLNHRSSGGNITGTYIQISTERLRKPMQSITNYILSAANLKPSAEVIPLNPNQQSG